MITRNWGFVARPYANLLGLNTPWNFFSPDPAQIVVLEYWVQRADDPNGENLERQQIPANTKQFIYDGTQRRVWYGLRAITATRDRIEGAWLPYVCAKHPGAKEVRLRIVVAVVPNLDRARVDSDTPVAELTEAIPSETIDLECPQ